MVTSLYENIENTYVKRQLPTPSATFITCNTSHTFTHIEITSTPHRQLPIGFKS